MQDSNGSVFATPTNENAVKTFRMIEDFVYSYIENKDKLPLKVWLVGKLNQTKVWGDDAERIADIIINQAQLRYDIRQSFERHIESGGSEEGFIAKAVEQLAMERGISNEEAAKLLDNLSVSFDNRLKTESVGEWNDYSRIEHAELIQAKAYSKAMISVVSQGKSALAEKIKNVFTRKESPSFQESVEKIIINAGAQASDDVGLNTAITAGYMSAAKSGFVKLLERFEQNAEMIPGMSMGMSVAASAAVAVAHAGALAIDTARVGYKLATGKISLEESGQLLRASATCQNLGSLALGAKGALIGASVAAIPIIGLAIAPITIVAGGVIGALVGSKIGKAVSSGIDAIKNTIGEKAVEKITEFAKSATKKAADFVKSIGSTITSGVKSIFSKIFS